MTHRALLAVDQALADVLNADVLHKLAHLVVVHAGLHRAIACQLSASACSELTATGTQAFVMQHVALPL